MAVKTVRDALNRALDEELSYDKKVFIIGEEVGHYNGAYKVTQGLLDKYGEDRVIDTPIAEAGFAGIGIGAAMKGLKPVVEFMTWNFSLVAIDQILSNAAKIRLMSGGQFELSMVFRAPQGAGGALGAQHSHVLENFFAYMPGLVVVVPGTVADMCGLLKSAIRDPNPVIFIESEKMYNYQGELPEEEYFTPIGKGIIHREGSDVTLVTWSIMVHVAMEAAKQLEKENISVEIIDPRTLRPLDEKLILDSVAKTNRAVILQEAWPYASFGASISQLISSKGFDDLDAPVELISSKDYPMPYAFNLEDMVLPSVEETIAAVKRSLS